MLTNTDIQIARSIQFAEDLLSGKDTGHRINTVQDTWAGVGPNQWIKISNRSYVVTAPNGGKINATWTVVKQSDGVTIKPVLEANHDEHIIFIYKPHPSINGWNLELPSGAKKIGETVEQASKRELEEETGFKAGEVKVIMEGMRFAPFRFDQTETVLAATQLTPGNRKLDYAEQLIEVHIIPVKMVEDLLKYHVITDFRTYAIAADHLLLLRNGE